MKKMIISKIKLKSQSAMEFIVLASFMLLVMLGFIAVTSSKILESIEASDRKIAEDLADMAYHEIKIASSVNDGYSRNFVMPQTVNGAAYTISITDNRELIVNYRDNEYIEFLPSNVSGNIVIGANVIIKKNGLISIN